MSTVGYRFTMPRGMPIASLVDASLGEELHASALVFVGSADCFLPHYRYVPRRAWPHEIVRDEQHVVVLLARPWKIALFEAASYWQWIVGALAIAIATVVR